MPAWIPVLVGMLPGLIADFMALLNAIEGKPTPAQAGQLSAMQSQIEAVFAAVKHTMASL